MYRLPLLFLFTALTVTNLLRAQTNEIYPGTTPLTVDGDIASQMIDGVDRFLLREIDASVEERAEHWNRDFSSPEAYNKSIEPNRTRLAHILGVRDERVPFDSPELIATTNTPALVGKGDGFEVFAVRWPVFGNVHGEGLLLVPDSGAPIADIVAVPDADQTPEQIVGLTEGVPIESQFARRLAENGCRVIVPTLISREMKRRAPPGQGGRANMTNREYIYRSAFEMGRHLIGYEVQKVLAAVDWFAKDVGERDPRIGVIGYGEGGMLTLYAGALDPRVDATCVSGYFGTRENIWAQPLDRNVFGLLTQFGDAELALMHRHLVIDDAIGPIAEFPSDGGAPASLTASVNASSEVARVMTGTMKERTGRSGTGGSIVVLTSIPRDQLAFCRDEVLQTLLVKLQTAAAFVPNGAAPKSFAGVSDGLDRQQRQLDELDRYTQHLLHESPFVRKEFVKKLDTSSVEAYEKSVEAYRDIFRDEVIGSFDHDLLPFNTRSRKSWETEKWTGYEVMLDVFPDVFAYGALLVPKDISEGERRPVVVCQHGLEGRPTDVFLDDHRAYHDFAAKLCEQGFITFAPQNIYIFKDRFRTLQRKANSVGKTLFSVMVPQHQQIVNWLKTQPNVDPDRIAFYGLSYGGKSAMRIPALVTDYCLSICSADFNEWVLKNASTRHNFSYVWTGEYEIFEFDLGSTFNYAEMAALICPRPFMVERGHFDGVGEDEWVAYEYAKIRHLYQAKLGIGDRTEIEWFVGPHTINGQGTFEFLHKHLNWPKR
ncbi:MAG: dienelactone hydrolase family protein [Planctomycetaceae bacterium]|nr:dienelactone hydrolase family protein [Planctomycetales bacterium]MCB9925687.1 dienelactone hydrolase family protein [Planctomycetaceae bacterium]